MKKLILALVLLLTFSLLAQEKVNPVTKRSDQVNEWMKNIASDSSMRGKMMEMMIEKTEDNPQEMMMLVNLVLSNNEMHKMILEVSSLNADNKNNSIDMSGIMNENKNDMKMTEKKKRPILKK